MKFQNPLIPTPSHSLKICPMTLLTPPASIAPKAHTASRVSTPKIQMKAPPPNSTLSLPEYAGTVPPKAVYASLTHARIPTCEHTCIQGPPRPHNEEHPPVPSSLACPTPFPAPACPKPSSNTVWQRSFKLSTDYSQVLSGRPSHSQMHSRQLSAPTRWYCRTSLDDITSPHVSLGWKMGNGRGRRDSSSSYTPTVIVDDIQIPPLVTMGTRSRSCVPPHSFP